MVWRCSATTSPPERPPRVRRDLRSRDDGELGLRGRACASLAPILPAPWDLVFGGRTAALGQPGSTDRSAEILGRVSDPRVRILSQENGGAPSATAGGLAAASGEYVAFLDQDDLWTPDKLRRHVERMRRCPEVCLTFSWFSVINEHGRETVRTSPFNSRRRTYPSSFGSPMSRTIASRVLLATAAGGNFLGLEPTTVERCAEHPSEIAVILRAGAGHRPARHRYGMRWVSVPR